MSLSLSMIVRDEAETLLSCLESVAGIVDEIVVVDTGSVDNTPEIAREFGATVREFPWCEDFAAARNAALAHTPGDWVLVLDADEVLLPSAGPKIKQVITRPAALLVQLLRQEVGAAQSPFSLLSRLFRRHPGVEFHRPYHESVEDSVVAIQTLEPHWQVLTLPEVTIQHSGYGVERIQSRRKAERAERIMKAYWQQHPQDLYIASKLGALYLETGELQAGLTLLEQAIRQEPPEPAIAFELHYHLGIAYTHKQDWERAIHQYQAALQQPILEPLKLSAYNNLGTLYQELGHLEAALAAFQQVVALQPDSAVGHYNLGITWRGLGNCSAAIAAYQTALRLQPNYADAYRNLGVVLMKVGQIPESLKAFRLAIAQYEQQQSPEAVTLREGLQALGLRI